MDGKISFVKCLVVGVVGGLVVLGGGCGGLIKVGTAKDATPPVVRFTTRPEFGVVPVAVKFDASATSDSESLISSYSWDFDGDGKEDSTAQAVTFTYQQPGVYYPRLKVVNSEGLVSYSTGSEVVANDKVYIRIETDKEVYKIGEEIKINLTLVNVSKENFLIGPAHELLIYNSNGEAVWKWHNLTIAEYVQPNWEIPIGAKTLSFPRPWHQNYGYESLDIPYGPKTSQEIIRAYFPEYKGQVEKAINLEQVLPGTYGLKMKIGGNRYVWGYKTIQITKNF